MKNIKYIKVCHYWFNRQELLEEANRYHNYGSKEKTAEY